MLPTHSMLARIKTLLRTELTHLTTVQVSDRRWQMPFAAALASGLPLLIGAYFGRMDCGLISSLGGLVFLYMPETALPHRMVTLMACAFGMIASYTLGLLSHLQPPVMTLALTFTSILVTMVCRFFRLPPPGSLFFIMAASIGAYTPGDVLMVPLQVGLLTMGCLLSCLIGFFYSLYILSRREPKPITPLPAPTFDFVVFDSLVIGCFVGISIALAQVLQMEKAYWAPISCLAVIQGMSLRAVWNKQLQRILGTGVGLLLAWALLMIPFNPWTLALVMMLLSFIIETLVVRHYATAAIFITPMTILLAEAVALNPASALPLIQARFWDTVLGSVLGLLGGICLHSASFRGVVSSWLKQWVPTPNIKN